jgi:hypothetical protein
MNRLLVHIRRILTYTPPGGKVKTISSYNEVVVSRYRPTRHRSTRSNYGYTDVSSDSCILYIG